MRALLLVLVLSAPLALAVPVVDPTAFREYHGVATQDSADAQADWQGELICGREHGWWRETYAFEIRAGAPDDELGLTITSFDQTASGIATPGVPAQVALTIWVCDTPTFLVEGVHVLTAAPYRVTWTSAFVGEDFP